MEELAKIITTLSLITGVDRINIVSGGTANGRTTRHILCHVVRNGYPHLMKPLCEMTGLASVSVHKYAHSITEQSREDERIERILKAVERSLDVKTPKPQPVESEKPTVEKKPTRHRKYPKWNPFGLTVLDDIKRHAAIRSANEFMEKFCKIGLQPIADGMVYTRKKSERNWYDDSENMS